MPARRILTGFALCLLAGAASAQSVPPYVPEATTRPDETRNAVPAMAALAPAARDAAAQKASIDRFRGAYAARKSPRIAIFWNRVLTDDVESAKQHVEREDRAVVVGGAVTTRVQGGGSTSIQPYGYGSLEQRSAGGEAQTTFGAAGVSVRERTTTDVQQGFGARAPAMIERDSWRFESGFADLFTQAGARLVDRNTIIRVTGDKSNMTDKQRVEMSALRGFADLFVEVLVTSDPASPSGYVFRATAKDVNTGQLIADVTSDGADAESGATEFVATNHGFESRPSRMAGAANGGAIAAAMMDRLCQVWQR
jgi:hypothetical protein